MAIDMPFAHSAVPIIPLIAMAFSTWLENYRWTWLSIAGALLALGGMAAALSGRKARFRAPDAV